MYKSYRSRRIIQELLKKQQLENEHQIIVVNESVDPSSSSNDNTFNAPSCVAEDLPSSSKDEVFKAPSCFPAKNNNSDTKALIDDFRSNSNIIIDWSDDSDLDRTYTQDSDERSSSDSVYSDESDTENVFHKVPKKLIKVQKTLANKKNIQEKFRCREKRIEEYDKISESMQFDENKEENMTCSEKSSKQDDVYDDEKENVDNWEDNNIFNGNDGEEYGSEQYHYNNQGEMNTNENEQDENIQPNSNLMRQNEGRKKRGRKREYGGLLRVERSKNKYMHKEYSNYKKRVIPAKEFEDIHCRCKQKCWEKVSIEVRKNERKKFLELGTYLAQSLYIKINISEYPKKRCYVKNFLEKNVSKKKEFSRIYKLQGIQVCRDLFVYTYGISPNRVNTILRKSRTYDSITDQRGVKQGGFNRLKEIEISDVMNQIRKIPTYKSHYARAETDSKYFASDMTLTKMYSMYKEEKTAKNEKPVSVSSYNKIFYKNFNIKFKAPRKDTCNTCDTFHNKLKTVVDEEEKLEITKAFDEHKAKAYEARDKMKYDLKRAAEMKEVETLTFDLQKTLPLPRIPTNLVYYKRQLWVYNCGIHSGKDNQGYCYLWIEGTAGRGSQEVGSCLKKHLTERVSEDIEEIIFWSDSCGGQNRNIKIVLMCKTFFSILPNLKRIFLRFLIPGHTYLPNDDDFGKIETKIKKQERIYTVEEYADIMKKARIKMPLRISLMQKEDFVGTEVLERKVINRKTSCDKTPVSWLKTREILLEREKPYIISMNPTFNQESRVEVNIKKRNVRGPESIQESDLVSLWPEGKPINPKKIKDLKALYPFIPQQAINNFYKKLIPADQDTVEDIDGFNDTLDFELMNEEEVLV